MYIKFAPKFNNFSLPLLAIDAGYQRLIKQYDKNCYSFYQFVCCFQGQGIFNTNSESINITPGTVIFIQPGVEHYYSINKEVCLVSWVSFEGYLIEKISTDDGIIDDKLFSIIQDHSHPNIHLNIMSILELMDDPFTLHRISTILYRMIIEFFLQHKCNVTQHNNPDKQEKIIASAIEWMKRNIHLPPNITLLANELHISRQHLCRLFQHKFQVSTKEYFTLLKILQSQNDLVEFAEKPIKDIALNLSFINASHFTRVFKQVTGVSPATFRNSYQSKG